MRARGTQADAVRRYHAAGWEVEQIAVHMDLPPSYVRRILARRSEWGRPSSGHRSLVLSVRVPAEVHAAATAAAEREGCTLSDWIRGAIQKMTR